MVIGALGTKAKKIVKFFRKSPRPSDRPRDGDRPTKTPWVTLFL